MARVLILGFALFASGVAVPAFSAPVLIDDNVLTPSTDLDNADTADAFASDISTAGTDGNQQAADDFSFTGADYNLSSLTWWGLFFDSSGGDLDGPDLFSVEIFSDSGSGSPGSSLAFASITATREFSSPGTVLGFDVIEYVADLSMVGAINSLVFTSGEVYWLSILNDTDIDVDTWRWVRHEGSPNGGNAHFRVYDVDDMTLGPQHGSFALLAGAGDSVNSDLAFVLGGIETLDAVAPEPSSLALLATGAFGLVGYGWRRRKQGTQAAA